jgi:hypothetical protein
MPDIITVSKLIGAATTILVACIAAIIWLRPVRITPGIRLVLDGSGPDEITATVVNKSSKAIYITECVARGTFTWRYVLGRHLRQPLMPLRFYPVVRFGGPVHDLMPDGQVKVEAQQPIDFRHRLNNHPLSKLHTSLFLVEVTLSSGRKFRSKKQRVPARWRLQRAA